MKIIEGFEAAKIALTAKEKAEFYPVSARLRRSLIELFGIDDPEQVVKLIIDEVRNKGDKALFEYTKKIDGIKLDALEINKTQITNAYQQVESDLLSALKLAAERIQSFHSVQKERILSGFAEQSFGQLVRPLEFVGVYAPGGTASYPSTVLMAAIPARVAGVKEVILVTPPGINGAVPAATLVAADIAGIDRVFAIGGAQAIAALAFGTESVPRVDKICGPGNVFVVLAKKMVYGAVGIDGLAGPSEVLIIADETANPEYCAADLLAQAEHDPLASSILITTSRNLANEVNQEIEQQIRDLPRQNIAAESIKNEGKILVVSDIDEALNLANIYAAEHLLLMIDEPNSYLNRITNAGCIFIGGRSTVTFGDYVDGPSHVLPTGKTARFNSPLNIMDFIKFINIVDISEGDKNYLGQAAITIARAEGLEAHARAVEKRLKS
ncbi:MAG: histidinol dehydrogenase [Dehalococcoidales bacterium]|nr:histidinol dehydrogenase [Dehalococcoidales bacterium]